MRRLLTLVFAALAASLPAARGAEPGAYAYPVRGVAGLHAASFGEIRPGHFHAGIDIKSDGAEGKELAAVADGYVARIIVTPGGYGRALYLALRDGRTAVYGHLQRFRDDIEERLRSERYARRANDVDLHFAAGEYPVRRGDLVGYSGNSGASMGPHLHFELRESRTQRRCNILREGHFRPADDLPPRIVRIHYIEIDTLDGIAVEAPAESYAAVRTAEGRYRLTRNEPVGIGRRGYFVVEATDRRNGVHNTFGIWRLTASIDREPYFEYRMEGFAPEAARCCDAVSRYGLQLRTRNEAIRLAQAEGAPDCFYRLAKERGLVRTDAGRQRRIRIEAEDDMGNRSSLEFTVEGRAEEFRARREPGSIALRHDRAGSAAIGHEATARIPAGALYASCYCHPERREAPAAVEGAAVLSPAYRMLDAATPLRHPMTVSIRAEVPRALQLRAALARRTAKGDIAFVGGHYAGGTVTAATRATGELFVVADTLPPVVRPLFAEEADLGGEPALRFRVGDNLAGIAACRMTIDGAWVPCDRFPMRGTLVHFFDTPATRRRHTVRLTVTDAVGNTARWEGSFYR